MPLIDILFDRLYSIRVKLHTFFIKSRFLRLASHIHPNVNVTNPEFISIGSNVDISSYTWIYAIKNDRHLKNVFTPMIEIHDGVRIGRFCHITCSNRLIIEDNVFISEGVLITDSLHGYEDITLPVIQQPLISQGPVIIGSGSLLGNGARIVGKVTIGKNVVVGSNAFVDKDVPDYTVVAGVPARIIKRYDPVQQKWIRVNSPSNSN